MKRLNLLWCGFVVAAVVSWGSAALCCMILPPAPSFLITEVGAPSELPACLDLSSNESLELFSVGLQLVNGCEQDVVIEAIECDVTCEEPRTIAPGSELITYLATNELDPVTIEEPVIMFAYTLRLGADDQAESFRVEATYEPKVFTIEEGEDPCDVAQPESANQDGAAPDDDDEDTAGCSVARPWSPAPSAALVVFMLGAIWGLRRRRLMV